MFRTLVLAVTLFLTACATAPEPGRPPAPVILISLDGFRPDYLDRGVTPVLNKLAAEGVRGAMRPSFPSKTFPNHYALVTGLRPDRNGIVENTMEDPAIPGVIFKMSNRDAVLDRRWWDEGEPIWAAAERAGMVTAPNFWPGVEAPIRGVRPRHYDKFDMETPNPARVDRLLSLLDLPAAERPRFLTLYFDTVDTAGHDYGPAAPETTAAVADADAQLGRLVAGLKARGLAVNLVYRSLAGGAFMTIYPAKGHEAEVDKALIRPHERFQCWRKAEIPARFHYGKNPRVAPYFCLPQTGWQLTTRDYRPKKPELGGHGYDNESPEMAAVFVANGPAFRKGVTLPTFDNVSVYPLLARLLGVRPAPNDGKPADTAAALAR
jgi:predicted AlkP superfamily pyrophosphatase or phosphodiesterase